MDEAWKKARREELWKDAVIAVAQAAGINIEQPRIEVAKQLLEIQKSKYLSERKVETSSQFGLSGEALFAFGQARLTWQLLNYELYDWLVEPPSVDIYGAGDPRNDQFEAGICFDGHLATGGPLHREGFDPIAVMVPRRIAQMIADGFRALGHGETQPIFSTSVVGQHKQAYTWDQMRLRAVQHVAFLSGSGSTKKSARDRVALATKIKSDTLRSWETDLKKQPVESMYLEWARKAGELSRVLEDNPSYASLGGCSIDGYAYAVLIELQREPLGAFGQRYREHRFDTRQG